MTRKPTLGPVNVSNAQHPVGWELYRVVPTGLIGNIYCYPVWVLSGFDANLNFTNNSLLWMVILPFAKSEILIQTQNGKSFRWTYEMNVHSLPEPFGWKKDIPVGSQQKPPLKFAKRKHNTRSVWILGGAIPKYRCWITINPWLAILSADFYVFVCAMCCWLKNTFAKHVMQLFSLSIYLCHNLPSVSKSNPNWIFSNSSSCLFKFTINWPLHYLVGGIPTPLKNMKVNGKDSPIYCGK